MNLAIRLGITFLLQGVLTHLLIVFYRYMSRPFPDYYEDH